MKPKNFIDKDLCTPLTGDGGYTIKSFFSIGYQIEVSRTEIFYHKTFRSIFPLKTVVLVCSTQLFIVENIKNKTLLISTFSVRKTTLKRCTVASRLHEQEEIKNNLWIRHVLDVVTQFHFCSI